MNIEVKGKRYRLTSRFFFVCYLAVTILLCTVTTIDFENRINKPHGRFYAPVSKISSIGYQKSLGEFKITHYSASLEECGKTDGICKNGEKAIQDYTIATDPSVIPTGTIVVIDGKEYKAMDVGGAIKGNRIDLFVSDKQEAINRGVITREVFIKGEN